MPVARVKKTVKKSSVRKAVKTKSTTAKVSRPRKKVATAMPPKDEIMPGWVALDDAAIKIGHVSVLFLEKAIHQGKLKAFKNGNMWFTTEEWIQEYKHHIKSKIDEEIVAYQEDAAGPRWVQTATKKKSIRKKKISTSFALAGVLCAALLSASTFIIMGFSERFVDSVVSIDAALTRGETGTMLLSQIENFYNAPLVVENYVVQKYVAAFDAASEKFLATETALDASLISIQQSLAHAAEKKINDEQFTAHANARVHELADKIVGQRSGRVAGAADSVDGATSVENVPSDSGSSRVQWIKNIFKNLKESLHF